MGKNQRSFLVVLVGVICFILISIQGFASNKALTFTDVMKFRSIQNPTLSNNGKWIAYTAKPDRGNGSLYVFTPRAETRFKHERGTGPVFSRNSQWLAAAVEPDQFEVEKKQKAEDE